jgi:hypothetical protein
MDGSTSLKITWLIIIFVLSLYVVYELKTGKAVYGNPLFLSYGTKDKQNHPIFYWIPICIQIIFILLGLIILWWL